MTCSFAPRFFHAACAALVLLAPAVLRAQSGTLDKIHRRDRLIVGSDMVFPTFNFKNPDTGRAEGFMADLARALAKQLLGDENKVEFRHTEEKTRLEAVARGEIDVLIDTIPASEEKLKVVDFSDETFRSGSALLVKAGSPIKTIDDITKGTRVIYSQANPDIKFIRAKAPEATYLEFENSTEAVAALRGKYRNRGPSTDAARSQARADDAARNLCRRRQQRRAAQIPRPRLLVEHPVEARCRHLGRAAHACRRPCGRSLA